MIAEIRKERPVVFDGTRLAHRETVGIASVVPAVDSLLPSVVERARARFDADGALLACDLADAGPIVGHLDGPAIADWFRRGGLAGQWGTTPSAAVFAAVAEAALTALVERERQRRAEADRLGLAEREATVEEADRSERRAALLRELAALEPAESSVDTPQRRGWRKR